MFSRTLEPGVLYRYLPVQAAPFGGSGREAPEKACKTHRMIGLVIRENGIRNSKSAERGARQGRSSMGRPCVGSSSPTREMKPLSTCTNGGFVWRSQAIETITTGQWRVITIWPRQPGATADAHQAIAVVARLTPKPDDRCLEEQDQNLILLLSL